MRLCLLILCGFFVAVVGCASPETTSTENSEPRILANGEPSEITVQHCLIAFKGSLGDKPVSRSKESAADLAAELLEKVNAGEDFDAIVKAYTNDSAPGIYQMVNSGLPTSPGVHSRDGMVPAFGDVGFKLEVGEYGLSEHDQRKSPYGWHIIKRLK